MRDTVYVSGAGVSNWDCQGALHVEKDNVQGLV
jgi:hypothetical protein